MLEKLFYFLRGYLILELQGDATERFLNLCKNRGLEIRHIYTINKIWYLKLTCKEFKIIYSGFKKSGCRCRIVKKIGLPFLITKCKKRKGLLLGGLLFALILWQCSLRIWEIEVEGGFLHTREQITNIMEEQLGIYGGVLSAQVDCFEIEKKLRLTYNQIGWISVEKRGCHIYVMLNESTMPKEAGTRQTPGHIVAERDGIVRRMEVKKGIPMVKIGDTVKKGDVLISGVVPIIGDFEELLRNEPVAALGSVYIQSDFSYDMSFPLYYEQKNFKNNYTGVEFFWKKRKLFSYIPRYSEGKYDIMCIDIVPYAFKDYNAPVLIRKYKIMPYDSQLIKMSEQEANEKAESLFQKFLADWESQDVQILQSGFSSEVKGKSCLVTGTITACGNFISYQDILEEEWKTEHEYRGDNP